MLEHLERALRFTREHVGAHGLPLLGFADWNDTVNLPTGAESLFNASLYGRGLLALIELADFQGDVAAVERYRTAYAEMAERVNEAAWDGGWYVRYFNADGTPVGSAQNAEGKIFSNGQSWPVIAGFAPPARAQAALDAVYAQLNTACGIKLERAGLRWLRSRQRGRLYVSAWSEGEWRHLSPCQPVGDDCRDADRSR